MSKDQIHNNNEDSDKLLESTTLIVNELNFKRAQVLSQVAIIAKKSKEITDLQQQLAKRQVGTTEDILEEIRQALIAQQGVDNDLTIHIAEGVFQEIKSRLEVVSDEPASVDVGDWFDKIICEVKNIIYDELVVKFKHSSQEDKSDLYISIVERLEPSISKDRTVDPNKPHSMISLCEQLARDFPPEPSASKTPKVCCFTCEDFISRKIDFRCKRDGSYNAHAGKWLIRLYKGCDNWQLIQPKGESVDEQ